MKDFRLLFFLVLISATTALAKLFPHDPWWHLAIQCLIWSIALGFGAFFAFAYIHTQFWQNQKQDWPLTLRCCILGVPLLFSLVVYNF